MLTVQKVTLLFVLPFVASEMARIYVSQQQLLTSSTLDWRPPDDPTYQKVTVGQSSVAWCKMRQNSVWVTGGVFDGQCMAPLLQKTVRSLATQVLYSLNGFTRLEYVYWDRQERIPNNAVSSGNVLLAFKEDPALGFLPGYVDPQRRRGYFLKGDRIIKNDSGILLVEKEPQGYRLQNVVYTKVPKTNISELTVSDFRLQNPDHVEKVVTKTVSFTAPLSIYYGRVPGTLTGLTTAVPSPEGGVAEILWNRIYRQDRVRSYEIRRLLPARSYVQVLLKVTVRSLEVPYGGELTALFDDGVRITRNVSGPHSERRMAELKGLFEGPYSLEGHALLAPAANSLEVLLHSSTTTSTQTSLIDEHAFEESQYQGVTDAACDFSARMTIVFGAILMLSLLQI